MQKITRLQRICAISYLSTLSVLRFSGLFWPNFDSFCGDSIRNKIQSQQKESKIDRTSYRKRSIYFETLGGKVKRYLVCVLALFCCSLIHANRPERIESLSCKVIMENTNGYFVLSDRSCWKAITFLKRWRSINEWWNGAELIPKNYECVPNNWFLGSTIEVFSKYGNLEVNEENASNVDEIRRCTHLLRNPQTGQIIFAIALEPAECLSLLYCDASEESYSKGYQAGRLASYHNSTEIYNQGYNDGYNAGYRTGRSETGQ